MVRVPDWAFETAAGQEMRGMGQDTASYHPGLYLTEPQVCMCILLNFFYVVIFKKKVKWQNVDFDFDIQREAVEALIQELPKFMLKAVPTDCSECPICLEEFHVGNEVLSNTEQ